MNLLLQTNGTSGTDLSGYTLTLVARWCPRYLDIMANGARNNLQESLRDLGIDSKYNMGGGDQVNPTVEAQFNPNCMPIPPGIDGNSKGWKFQIGNGIAGPKVNNLSTVSGAPNKTLTTLATNGSNPVGSVTIELTNSEKEQAQNHNLWVQGGTSGDPLNQQDFGNIYGFGALRCAIDNLNGDNVEWVGFSNGVKSVYCYYYAVTPAPGYGTINVTKRVTNSDTTTTFPFHGSVSFNTVPVQGYFSVKANQTATFTRASGTPWQITEDVPGGWKLDNYSCTSTNGKSTFTYPQTPRGTSAIALADLDTVNCTYTDSPAALTIDKKTVGGIGGPFTYRIESSGRPSGPFSATTSIDGLPVRVYEDSPGSLSQTYTVTEVGTQPG